MSPAASSGSAATAIAWAWPVNLVVLARRESRRIKRPVAFVRTEGTNSDILVLNPAPCSPTRLTFETGTDSSPLWTPDGSRVIYYSVRSNVRYLIRATGGGGGGGGRRGQTSTPAR